MYAAHATVNLGILSLIVHAFRYCAGILPSYTFHCPRMCHLAVQKAEKMSILFFRQTGEGVWREPPNDVCHRQEA